VLVSKTKKKCFEFQSISGVWLLKAMNKNRVSSILPLLHHSITPPSEGEIKAMA